MRKKNKKMELAKALLVVFFALTVMPFGVIGLLRYWTFAWNLIF